MPLDKTPLDIPSLTVAQMVEVDRIMVEDLGITLMQMMENAGRNLARLAVAHMSNDGSIVALVGSGGNGGGVLVAARRLAGWGVRVNVVLGKEADRLDTVSAHQLDSLVRLGVAVYGAAEVGRVCAADLVLDGLIGYSLKGTPRGAVADLIRWANEQPAPVLALDVPSGVDAGTGTVNRTAGAGRGGASRAIVPGGHRRAGGRLRALRDRPGRSGPATGCRGCDRGGLICRYDKNSWGASLLPKRGPPGALVIAEPRVPRRCLRLPNRWSKPSSRCESNGLITSFQLMKPPRGLRNQPEPKSGKCLLRHLLPQFVAYCAYSLVPVVGVSR